MPAEILQRFWDCSNWSTEAFRFLSVLRSMNSADLLSKEPGLESKLLCKELFSRPFRLHFIWGSLKQGITQLLVAHPVVSAPCLA